MSSKADGMNGMRQNIRSKPSRFREEAIMGRKKSLSIILLFVFLAGCVWIPARKEVKVDLNLPVGNIEGNQLTGIRYPFKISAPPNWKVATEFPAFMEDLGFAVEGLEESEVFLYNPSTRSNLQIDFVGAGRYSRFNQKIMEWLVGTAATSSFKEEFENDYGKAAQFELGPTTLYSLKGVQYAAKKYSTYTLKGVKWTHGWIYGFSEPYQIFIIYMILEKEGSTDHQDMERMLNSFEMLSRK